MILILLIFIKNVNNYFFTIPKIKKNKKKIERIIIVESTV
jgi:hypothetical protein